MSVEFLSSLDFAELRRQAATATDFDRFWDFYLTCFVERAGFLKLGSPVTITRAVEVLEAAAGLIMDRGVPVPARNLVLREVPSAGIVHGSGVFDGRLAAVLYVPANDVGMLAVCAPGGTMKYGRFWLAEERLAAAALAS
jgi:hypothetical protein